jgi:CHAT domain-containing protein
MAGGPFKPVLLNSAVATRSLSARAPLVFLNACRSAGVSPEYSRMIGWAEQFMGAGAGAFVGTLWPVRSETASSFAELFYENLRAGDTLGIATQKARLSASKLGRMDPTWLAYSVYGDPDAVAA